jgi:hypothetical protein
MRRDFQKKKKNKKKKVKKKKKEKPTNIHRRCLGICFMSLQSSFNFCVWLLILTHVASFPAFCLGMWAAPVKSYVFTFLFFFSGTYDRAPRDRQLHF